MTDMQDNNSYQPASPLEPDTQSSWMKKMPEGGPVLQPPHASILKKIIFAAAGLFVVGLGVLGYVLFGSSDGEGVVVTLNAPEQFQRGVPTVIDVIVNNQSGSGLRDAQISLTLPDDFSFVGTPGSRTVENRPAGLLEDGGGRKESFTVMASGEENTVRMLKGGVSYVPGALSSRFEKTTTKDVVLTGEGAQFSFTNPSKVLAGEEFTLTIAYQNKANVAYDDAEILIKYPDGFSLRSAEHNGNALEDTSKVVLGAFAVAGSGNIVIKGTLAGQDEASFEFGATMNARVGELRYDIVKSFSNVVLAASPLSLRIETSQFAQKFPGPGATMEYRLTYTNNTDIPLKDVIVKASLVGEMFDTKTIKTEGFLRSADNSITWNASRVADLASLAPGATGVVTFSVATKPSYPITRLSSKNFTLTVKGSIESPTIPRGVATSKTVGLAQLTTKMRGALLFNASAFYRDPSVTFTNAGTLPPKVGKPLQLTIHWTLKNTSTDVENVSLKAFLSPNVRYTGIYKSSTDTGPTYNERTQEITWSVPKILATRGTISSPVELVFQVELVPAINQVGSYPEIIGPTSGEYTDVFIGEKSQLSDTFINLSLPDDQTTLTTNKTVTE